MVQGEIPGITPEGEIRESTHSCLTLSGGDVQSKATAKFIEDVKADVKSLVQINETDKMLNHVQNLIKQGKYLELCQLEQTDATWQGYIYNLPRGTMKFLLNSTIDTLPTKVNLKLWGKVSNDKCRCGSRQTLNHILNCCGPSLRDGRYTFRHDNVLSYIDKCLNMQKYTCYVDLEGLQTSAGGTIPPNLVVTTLKPDVVIKDKSKKTATIFEVSRT